MTARYAEFAPPDELAPYVACFWIFEGEDAAEDQRVAPDGRCELIVHHRTPYLERGADGGLVRQPATLFAGQLTKPLHLRADGPAGVVGARFTTAGAHAYVRRPMDALTDRRADLAELKGAAATRLAARMASAAGEAGRLACIAAHVWGEVRHAEIDPPTAAAVDALRASDGRIPLERLAGLAGLPPRTLQRRFASLVGVSPRTLAAVLRVRRLFDVLEAADSWSAAAQDAGYFDHPQMARDFRRFVGCTPSQFVAGRPGLAASLVANLQAERAATG